MQRRAARVEHCELRVVRDERPQLRDEMADELAQPDRAPRALFPLHGGALYLLRIIMLKM